MSVSGQRRPTYFTQALQGEFHVPNLSSNDVELETHGSGCHRLSKIHGIVTP